MAPHPIFRPNAVALITGGASGIGLAVAKLCASHSMRLAIVDWNAEALALVPASLPSDTDVQTYRVDVSKLDEWNKLKDQVQSRFGGIDMLHLNAGIGANGGWEDTAYFHKIMDTNLFGVINGLATFVPLIRARKEPTAVIVTGSKQGITNPPGNPAYNASKAAVKSLAESLSHDLRGTGTSVHLLVPGWTYTGLTAGGNASMKDKPAGAWTPEQVAKYMEGCMGRGEFYMICPDNDVSEEMDRKRMTWAMGDLVHRRPPLSRWREEWKEKSEEGMKAMNL
jgi:NAD(P)-dependent dehydrogenase (short-subunit alcohol dehydrogenase family)